MIESKGPSHCVSLSFTVCLPQSETELGLQLIESKSVLIINKGIQEIKKSAW